MRPAFVLFALLAMAASCQTFAQHEEHAQHHERGQHDDRGERGGHEQHGEPHGTQPAAQPPAVPPPSAAFSGPAHAADAVFGSATMRGSREQLRAEHGGLLTPMILADRFELRAGDGEEEYLWDLQGWYGGDIHKLWLKTEGEGTFGERVETVELQALYSRAVTPFFDLQAGVRHDLRPDPERSHLVLGLQGLLPYVFELDAAAFLSEKGDLTARLEGEYDLQLTQRLILQPRVELNAAAQSVPELGIGSGIGSVEAGLRLRYEIRRELAPYLGLAWEGKIGDTADFARAAGEERRSWSLVLGVRTWF